MIISPTTVPLLAAAMAGDDALAAALSQDGACEVIPGWQPFPESIAYAHARQAEDGDWGMYFFFLEGGEPGAPRRLVGSGGYKGAPSEGKVEFGYAIAESLRGRGLATAAARLLVERALADPAVGEVIAHTLPERNASNQLLGKLGFSFAGAIEDPEDGTIWRFSLRRDRPPGDPGAPREAPAGR